MAVLVRRFRRDTLFSRADQCLSEVVLAVAERRFAAAEERLYALELSFAAALGAVHPEVVHCRVLRATLARASRRWCDARHHADQVVELLEEAGLARAPGLAGLLAQALAERATIDQDEGRHRTAEPRWRRAIAVIETGLGAQYRARQSALMLRRLAELRAVPGCADEAEVLMQHLVDVAEEPAGVAPGADEHRNVMSELCAALGEAPIDVGTARYHLGMGLLAQGKLGAAAGELTIALATQEDALGSEHPHAARTAQALAVVRRHRTRLALPTSQLDSDV